jgi:hypothetical protein
MADSNTLYDEDFLAWSKQQAEALRAAAGGGSNQFLDWHNLAEEIESLGVSQHTALGSQVRRIIGHLVKLQYSRAAAPRRGWTESINDTRAEVEDLIETSPSLKAELDRVIALQMPRGVKLAIHDLRGYEEIDGLLLPRIGATTYSQEQILGDWFPEEPRG